MMEEMTEDQIVKILTEFFLEEFREDPAGVADWLVQGGIDANDFIAAVQKL